MWSTLPARTGIPSEPDSSAILAHLGHPLRVPIRRLQQHLGVGNFEIPNSPAHLLQPIGPPAVRPDVKDLEKGQFNAKKKGGEIWNGALRPWKMYVVRRDECFRPEEQRRLSSPFIQFRKLELQTVGGLFKAGVTGSCRLAHGADFIDPPIQHQ